MRNAKPLNPLKLDVALMAERGAELSGQWELRDLSRLSAEEVTAEAPEDPAAQEPADGSASAGSTAVAWWAQGQATPQPVGGPGIELRLKGQAEVTRRCQRCLQPVRLPLSVDRTFVFAADEKTAESWDESTDEVDVLVLTRSLDLRELLEDEFLLELPLVPRHDRCPHPLITDAPVTAAAAAGMAVSGRGRPTDPAPAEADAEREHPFAVLARLKRTNPSG